jgi:hypothetical protein
MRRSVQRVATLRQPLDHREGEADIAEVDPVLHEQPADPLRDGPLEPGRGPAPPSLRGRGSEQGAGVRVLGSWPGSGGRHARPAPSVDARSCLAGAAQLRSGLRVTRPGKSAPQRVDDRRRPSPRNSASRPRSLSANIVLPVTGSAPAASSSPCRSASSHAGHASRSLTLSSQHTSSRRVRRLLRTSTSRSVTGASLARCLVASVPRAGVLLILTTPPCSADADGARATVAARRRHWSYAAACDRPRCQPMARWSEFPKSPPFRPAAPPAFGFLGRAPRRSSSGAPPPGADSSATSRHHVDLADRKPGPCGEAAMSQLVFEIGRIETSLSQKRVDDAGGTDPLAR